MGFFGSKSVSTLAVPTHIPTTPKAIEDLVASIMEQRIVFGFRKVDPDSHGKEILKSVAKAISFLPDYAIRIDGHSNLAKSERKLTSEDRSRIQKLSEDRAEACARLLKAAGVENEITCVGQGALKGETKGCVCLVLFKKSHPPPSKTNEQPHATAVGADLAKTQQVIVAVDGATPSVAVKEKEPFTAETQDHVNQTQQDRTGTEEGPKSSDAEETDGPEQSSALIEPLLNAGDVDVNFVEVTVEPASTENVPSKEINSVSFSVVVEPEDTNKKAGGDVTAGAPVGTSAQAQQWGTTHLPWFIACCTQSNRPKTEECPMQGLPVKQIQLLQ